MGSSFSVNDFLHFISILIILFRDNAVLIFKANYVSRKLKRRKVVLFMYQQNKDINILIVDDTPEHIRIASSILKKLGHRIRAANNGIDALKLIEQQIPTLILLDINMSNLSGYDVCSIVKNTPSYESIAIIFVTAYQDEENIQKGFSLGAQDYVIKPYNASELLARVSTHIKLASQSNALKSSYAELDTFCHTVSHDLKSPLLVIKQLISLLENSLDSVTNHDIAEIMERLHLKSDQLLVMIDRLLEFSKSTQSECHFTMVNLTMLFQETIDELRSLQPDRNVLVTMPTLPSVYADTALLKLLAQNIISNALKFSKHQPVTKLEFTVYTNENFHEVTITDNGAGFDMKYADKLFHVFERLHTQEEFEGSGVGLAIIERIMQRHNGSVSITGAIDKGASIILKFPMK